MNNHYSKRTRHREVRFMFSDKFIFHTPGNSLRNITLLTVLITFLPFIAHAQITTETQEQDAVVNTQAKGFVDNLVSIGQAIKSKKDQVHKLEKQLKRLVVTSEKQESEKKIELIKKEITSLQLSFEHTVLGGVNLSVFAAQPKQQINWKEEIEQISGPILSTLKEITAKPRQIDSLQRDIDRLESQLKVAEKALELIRSLKSQPKLPPMVAELVDQLLIDWEQRRGESERTLEITHFKLANLKNDSVVWYISTWELIKEFSQGHGLTLLLATIISLTIWLVSNKLLRVYWRWFGRSSHDFGVTRAPLLYYSHRLATTLTILLAILMVLYVRGDVLFLTLALIALAGAALTLRQTLPRYAAEIRLLVGAGPVREEERLVYNSIPFNVESLSVYSVLRNPMLEGIVRLPIQTMNSLMSRPANPEPWFPCQPGDYILLANGDFAKVLRQTVELVEVAVRDSIVQIRTGDFIGQNIRNLTRDGFGIVSTFGVDYEHQALCLDIIPERFRDAINKRLEQEGLGDDIQKILVEFNAAGASSLDYLIYVSLSGKAASSYFKAQRLVQQACVDTCNQEGWIIPFTQITVHSPLEANEPRRDIDQNTDGPLVVE